jgi:uncharacterized membrane protein YecN with MAPEG domain
MAMHNLTLPVISAFTAGILIILQILLLAAVALARRRNRQSLGDGDNPDLRRAIRRHGNLAENAALFIAGFALLEMLGAPPATLEILCALFVLGRISHAVGLSLQNTVNPLRVGGVVLTVGVGLTLGVRLIQLALPLIPHTF